MYSAADDGTVSKSEEHVAKEWTELADVESWVHIRPHLKKQGGACDSRNEKSPPSKRRWVKRSRGARYMQSECSLLCVL